MSDPLFDPTQKGDEDLVAIERLLQTQRYKSPEKSWEKQSQPASPRGLRILAGGLFVATIAAVGFGAWSFAHPSDPWLYGYQQTGPGETKTLPLVGLGQIELGPETRVTMLEKNGHHLQLERGTMHAKVNAPPRIFLVDTPVAQAVDLGCEYTLHVAPNNRTELEVTFGRVALEDGKNSVTVYAGFKSSQSPKSPPRVPWPSDATPELDELIRQADVEHDAKALQQLIEHPCDATKHCLGPFEQQLALWHLAFRVDDEARKAVVAKLSEHVPPPAELDVDAFELSRPAMQKWLDDLFTH